MQNKVDLVIFFVSESQFIEVSGKIICDLKEVDKYIFFILFVIVLYSIVSIYFVYIERSIFRFSIEGKGSFVYIIDYKRIVI